MRAYALMKANVDAVLKARGIAREELSKLCHRDPSWASKILTNDKRWFPMPYWDRICSILGLEPYQLMQPGISAYTERRRHQRRSGRDRRISAMNHHVRESVSELIATLSERDVARIIRWKALGAKGQEAVDDALQATEHSAREGARRKTRRPPAETALGPPTEAAADDDPDRKKRKG